MELKDHPHLTSLLSQAIFVVNKHAKTAPNPKALYELKKESIEKMIQEGRAKKLGLHFTDNPKFSQQHSDVIVQCGDYIFHLPPTKDDIKNLPHFGSRCANKRNPKTYLSLSKAKHILQSYIGKNIHCEDYSFKPRRSSFQVKRNQHNSSTLFSSSFLGKNLSYYKK
jgi:hypothetical protein